MVNFMLCMGFLCMVNFMHVWASQGLSGKESTSNAGDTGNSGLISGLGRYPGEGNGNSLQYSCLGNLMDRGAWWAIVHEVTKESDMS